MSNEMINVCQSVAKSVLYSVFVVSEAITFNDTRTTTTLHAFNSLFSKDNLGKSAVLHKSVTYLIT